MSPEKMSCDVNKVMINYRSLMIWEGRKKHSRQWVEHMKCTELWKFLIQSGNYKNVRVA